MTLLDVLIPLGLKMILAAAVVVGASVAAERAGPLVGGIVLSLPVSAGPGYVFLALQADDAFVAESALFSFSAQLATFGFMATFVRVAPRRGLVASLGAAIAVWLVLAVLIRWAAPPWWLAVPLVALGFVAGARVIGTVAWPDAIGTVRPTRRDLLARAALTGALVATVVTASGLIGPEATGLAVVYPVMLTTIGWILHRRYGGAAAAAVFGGSLRPMLGFCGFVFAIHALAEPLGAAWALACGLAVSASWSSLLLAARRR